MEVAPFFVDFHHFLSIFTIFLSIFTIYTLLSRFTFCRDLRTFSAKFFGQNSLLRNITRFLHVCDGGDPTLMKIIDLCVDHGGVDEKMTVNVHNCLAHCCTIFLFGLDDKYIYVDDP